MSLNISKHNILVCAGNIEQNSLENPVVTPFELIIIDCKSAVVEKMDLCLRFTMQVTVGRVRNLSTCQATIVANGVIKDLFDGRALVNKF